MEKVVNELLSTLPEVNELLPYEILSRFEPGLCIDIGAAAGFSTKRMLQASPGSNIICFEPFEGNLPHLRENLEGIGNYKLVTKAVSDFSGDGKFFVSSVVDGSEAGWTRRQGYSSVGYLVSGEEAEKIKDDTRSYDIQVCTLDEYVSSPVLFMKMDVQGGELAVLTGAEHLFSDQGVKMLHVEFNGDIAVLSKLDELGFFIFDTEYMITPLVDNFTPDLIWMDEYKTLNLSTGHTAYDGFIRRRPRNFAEICEFMDSIRQQYGHFQTDLFCVHKSFFKQFLITIGELYE